MNNAIIQCVAGEYVAMLEFRIANPPVPAVLIDRTILSNKLLPAIIREINSININPI